jgi:carboxypeptidase C (cathepsin A)
MRSLSIPRFVVLFLIVSGLAVTTVQSKPNHPSPNDVNSDQEKQPREDRQPHGGSVVRLLPADSTTKHTIDLLDGKLDYTATAGTLDFYDQSGERSASLFYTAYVAKKNTPNRPLTFVFNGGPGAASAFLHLGLVGPRILDFGPNSNDAAHAALHDNPDTWLNFTDLVMIDPVGTGWSRAVKVDDAKHFWNVRSDADSMTKAIALYISKNNRAASPKYLLGESYGGFRAAKTARALQRDQGIAINGILMLSPLLEGWLTFGNSQSALRAALEFPSLAATELERKHVFTKEALEKTEKFAMTDYLTMLAGAPPQGEEARAFYARVAEITGLAPEIVTRERGFVADSFVKTFRSGKIVSRYDASFAIDDPFPEELGARSPDPILDGIALTYGGAFAAYARNELGFNTELTYQLLANDVTQHWDWQNGRSDVGIENDLRLLLSFHQTFRLLIANGYSDLVTPYAMTRYVLDHLPPIDPPGRTELKLYHGGHMFYMNPQSRKAFTTDAATFYQKDN